jgi:hypothetical protein
VRTCQAATIGFTAAEGHALGHRETNVRKAGVGLIFGGACSLQLGTGTLIFTYKKERN